MSGPDTYTHPFMLSRSHRYYTKTAPCILRVERVSNNNTSWCVMRIKKVGTVTVLDEAVEGPLFSSTYSIEYLNELVDKAHRKAGITPEKGEVPCIINWADVNGPSGRSTVFVIYSKVGNSKPWVVASFSNKYIGSGRVSFLAVLPSDLGLVIETCQSNDEELVFEVT